MTTEDSQLSRSYNQSWKQQFVTWNKSQRQIFFENLKFLWLLWWLLMGFVRISHVWLKTTPEEESALPLFDHFQPGVDTSTELLHKSIHPG